MKIKQDGPPRRTVVSDVVALSRVLQFGVPDLVAPVEAVVDRSANNNVDRSMSIEFIRTQNFQVFDLVRALAGMDAAERVQVPVNELRFDPDRAEVLALTPLPDLVQPTFRDYIGALWTEASRSATEGDPVLLGHRWGAK